MPTNHEYETRERTEFHQQIKKVEKLPLNERKENARAFAEALKHDPAIVAERVGWLLNGSYGYGSYKAAEQMLKAPRMNHGAWLTLTTAALEWGTPQKMAIAAWKALSGAQQTHLRKLIDREIKDHHASQ